MMKVVTAKQREIGPDLPAKTDAARDTKNRRDLKNLKKKTVPPTGGSTPLMEGK